MSKKRTNKLAVHYASNGELDRLKHLFEQGKATYLLICALSNGHVETAEWILSSFNKNNNVTKYINYRQFEKVFQSAYKYEFKTLEILLTYYKPYDTENIVRKIVDHIPVKGFDVAQNYLKFVDKFYDFKSINFINNYYLKKIDYQSTLKKEFINKYLKLKDRSAKFEKFKISGEKTLI